MDILMKHTALWLLAAAVLLPHALAGKGPDLSSSPVATVAVVNIAELSAGDKRRAEITLMGESTRAFKCLEYSVVDQATISRPSVCMKWFQNVSYVSHEQCGTFQLIGCWEGMQWVNREGTEECTCQKLSPDQMSCSDFLCKRDYIVQGGVRNSAPAARPCSTCITLLASLVLFLYWS